MTTSLHESRTTVRRGVALLGAILSLGCSNPTTASELAGTWTHDYGFPGSSFEMTLTTRANVVTGTGHWTGEACCAGSVAVNGLVENELVTLDLVLTAQGWPPSPFTQHFEGRILSSGLLLGTLTESGRPTSYTYRKIQ
jgi:hypothetical protein